MAVRDGVSRPAAAARARGLSRDDRRARQRWTRWHREARGQARVLDTMRSALLQAFADRPLAVSDAQRAAIERCLDSATLARWLVRAAVADSVDDALSR
jgi:hypothetical protein